ncbi:hypothetical protein JOM56_004548 [Amanita muscaria]
MISITPTLTRLQFQLGITSYRPLIRQLSTQSVPKIQFLIPEHQHDLTRVICGLEPISQPLNIAINGIAADLRAVVIEISQRRSFQDRYASDLQAALDADSSESSSLQQVLLARQAQQDPSHNAVHNPQFSHPLPLPSSSRIIIVVNEVLSAAYHKLASVLPPPPSMSPSPSSCSPPPPPPVTDPSSLLNRLGAAINPHSTIFTLKPLTSLSRYQVKNAVRYTGTERNTQLRFRQAAIGTAKDGAKAKVGDGADKSIFILGYAPHYTFTDLAKFLRIPGSNYQCWIFLWRISVSFSHQMKATAV